MKVAWEPGPMMRKMGGADDLDDSEIYASLLNRGYLMAAFNMANTNGGEDNITAVLVQIH